MWIRGIWLTLLSRPRVDENKVIDITSSAGVVVAAAWAHSSFAVHLLRHAIRQALVRPFGVVEVEVHQASLKVIASGVAHQIDALILDAPPKALNHDVVKRSGATLVDAIRSEVLPWFSWTYILLGVPVSLLVLLATVTAARRRRGYTT